MNEWFTAKGPLIIGHRGASADAPENSLAAFALALEQGADGIEFDVQLSADGHPMVMHDWTVDRTTNGHGSVSRLTLRELQSLDAGDGRPVPTLGDVLKMFGPKLLYNIELKEIGLRDHDLGAIVADRVKKHNLAHRTLISSFNLLALRRLRRHSPEKTPLALIRQTGLGKMGHWLVNGRVDQPDHSLVDEKNMEWARKRQLRIHVWTVDDPAEAQRLVSLGVHGIITNKRKLIRQSVTLENDATATNYNDDIE